MIIRDGKRYNIEFDLEGNPLLVHRATGEVLQGHYTEVFPGDIILSPDQQKARKRYMEELMRKAGRRTASRDLGKYFFIAGGQRFSDLKPQTAARLIYLQTFCDFAEKKGNRLKLNAKQDMRRADLQKVLGLSYDATSAFWKEVFPNYLTEDDNGLIFSNLDMFVRGKINPGSSYYRAYVRGVRKLYEETPKSKHRHVGYLFQLLPFVNIEYNAICWNPEEQYIEEIEFITLFDLKPQHIQDFYSNRMGEHHTGAKTIHRYHANIHKALAYAVKMGRIASNPADMVELPKAQEHQADFYTVDELKTVIEKARGTQIEPIVMLASWFGLRRGEIIGLRWSSINFDAKVLSITGVVKDKGESGSKIKNMYYVPTAKTKSSLRSFPLNDEMILYLKNLKAQQDRRRTRKGYNDAWSDFVCVRDNGDLIPLEYVSRAFPKLCEECGLRKLKLHELRHTNISLLLAEGATMRELQLWAGHSNYSVTANTYAHIQAKSKSKLTESISSLLA